MLKCELLAKKLEPPRVLAVYHVASYGALQFPINSIVFLETRDSHNYFTDPQFGRLDTYSLILLPWIKRIEGSNPFHPASFLRLSKMLLRISLDAFYNGSR